MLCRARNVKKLSVASSIDGSSRAGLPSGGDDGDDAEERAERGGLVGLQGIKAIPGRPNIRAVLSGVCRVHCAVQEIGVIAAGARRFPP